MAIEEHNRKKEIEEKAEEIYQNSIDELKSSWEKASKDDDPVEGAYEITEAIMKHYDLEDFNETEQQTIREIVEENAFNGLT